MNNIFTFILQMSVSASIIALIVMIARYFLRNSPKIYSYILWAAVLLRLVCPFSLTLEIPVETQAEPLSPTVQSEQVATPDTLVSEEPVYSVAPEYPSDTVIEQEHTNSPVSGTPNDGKSKINAVKPVNILTAVWLIGVAAMLGYMAWSYISLYSHVKTSTRVRGTVFKSDRINTAFVLGLINPRVYIPSYLSFDDAKGVILHEQTHIRRGDHIVKIVAFASLAVHWFNPFIWLSYWLMSIDMEHSCDEAVMEGLCDRGYKLSGVKRGYGQILISLAIKDIKMPSVAFSENNVKGRLSHILNYKGASNNTRKILWASCAALFILCALLPVIKGTEVDAVNSGHIAGSPIDYSAVELDYSNAGLDDLSAFADCKNLVSLDLSGNSITDISPLAEISTLKSLDLSENNISNFSALGSLNSLPELTQCFIVSDRYENGNLGIAPELPSEGLEFEITDGQAYVTGYSGKDSDIVIASSYCGFPITRIADRAFSGSSITSIFMPDSIQTIGDEAFFNCTDLSVIRWSQSLKSLGEYSFSHCESLRELILPDSLSQMGYSCFAECTAITEIHFSEKLSVIPKNCFSGCLSLTAVTIPKTVSEVSYHAFYNTPNLKEAHVISGPSLCSVMGFSENTTVNISYEVGYKGLEYELIDGKAYVTGYTYIPVDESAISVEDCSDTPIIPYIYEGCPVVGIADGAFSGDDCRNIRSMNISYGITQIGARAFSGCSDLVRIDIPTSLNDISPSAFDGCSDETVVMSDKSEYLLMYFADKDVEYHPEYKLVDIYADEGLTGTTTQNRSELHRLIRDCNEGKLDRVIIKSVSRLARNTRDLLVAIRMFKDLGVSIYFEEQDIDTEKMNMESMSPVLMLLR